MSGAGRLTQTVALVGMMGSGKTAIGTALAARLDVPFRDSDHEIELAANLSIAEIFEREGEPFFRAKEAQVITRLLEGPPCILSTGGGAWLQPATRALIEDRGIALCLKADLELLWTRVRHKSTRPLLRTTNPKATLAEILAARAPFYEEAGVVVEAAPELSIAQMTDKVLAALIAAGVVVAEGGE